MQKADIWMPLYIGDYLADTARLTTEQHGAYLLLLMDYWRSGRLPDNDQVLAQISKLSPDAWSNAKAMLMQFFSIKDGFWVHSRVEKELNLAMENKAKMHDRASKAALARWKNANSNANAMLMQCPSPSPSPSPILKTNKRKEKKKYSLKTRIPEDFHISENVRLWASKNNYQQLDRHFENFVNSAKAKEYEYADWDAAFRNAISQDWAKINTAKPQTASERNQSVLSGLTRGLVGGGNNVLLGK